MDVSTIRNRKGQRLDAAYHAGEREDLLVVLGHGVTGNKDRPLLVGVATELAARGLSCVRVSFAGNGASEGRFEECTISGEAEDLEDLLSVFAKEGRRIVYVGHSMGGAVGVLVAAREPVRIRYLVTLAGMVETAAFFEREFGGVTPGAGCMWDEPDCPLSQVAVDDARAIGSTLAAAGRVTQPWLLVHGTEDDVVPPSDSRAALALARAGTRMLELPGEGHPFSAASYPLIADAIEQLLAGDAGNG